MSATVVALDLGIGFVLALAGTLGVLTVVMTIVELRRARAKQRAPRGSIGFQDGFARPLRRDVLPEPRREPAADPQVVPDVRVEVVLADARALTLAGAPSAEPGARSTVTDAYDRLWPTLFEVGGDHYTFDLRFPPGAAVAPAVPVRGSVWFTRPELVVPRLAPGTTFRVWAGGQIGHGTVLEVVDRGAPARAARRARLRKRYGDLHPRVLSIVREADPAPGHDREAYERLTESILPRLRGRDADGIRRALVEDVERVLGASSASSSARWHAAADRICEAVRARDPSASPRRAGTVAEDPPSDAVP